MTRNAGEVRSSLASRAIVATVAGGLVVAMYTEALAARRGGVTVVPLGSFVDQMTGEDTTRWAKADGWVNGSPFANAWRSDHVKLDEPAGAMSIRLSNVADLGMLYSSGEYWVRYDRSATCDFTYPSEEPQITSP